MDDHSRTIVHIDIDCFYAQVEMIKQPSLKHKPIGIQQKNIVVTSNYVARESGIQKCMSIAEARNLCPNLILVNGEDLYDYRHISNKVSDLLREYSELVERLGLDENFIDITLLVNEKLASGKNDVQSMGHKFGDDKSLLCDCGCIERISIGSQIAQEMRVAIFEKIQLTTCAGIAHNKLLAKIVCTKNKPNNQTLLFPNSASELMLSLEHVKNIPWVGSVTSELLNKINVNIVEDLQNCDIHQLENIFDSKKARNLKNLSFGIDIAPVKRTGKPQSIGLEYACNALTAYNDVEHKVRELFPRLITLVKEDGRFPKVLKVTVRKLDKKHPLGSVRGTMQCDINNSLNNEEQLTSIAMGLIRKIVTNKMFKVTLVGLSFSKFVDKPNQQNTLVSFVSKDLKVPSVDNSNSCPFEGTSSLEGNSVLQPPPKRSKFSETTNFAQCSSTTACKNIKGSLIENSSEIATDCVKEINCPPGIDKTVFQELPFDVQVELRDDYQNQKHRDKQMSKQKSSKATKNNTLFNYMVRESKK